MDTKQTWIKELEQGEAELTKLIESLSEVGSTIDLMEGAQDKGEYVGLDDISDSGTMAAQADFYGQALVVTMKMLEWTMQAPLSSIDALEKICPASKGPMDSVLKSTFVAYMGRMLEDVNDAMEEYSTEDSIVGAALLDMSNTAAAIGICGARDAYVGLCKTLEITPAGASNE